MWLNKDIRNQSSSCSLLLQPASTVSSVRSSGSHISSHIYTLKLFREALRTASCSSTLVGAPVANPPGSVILTLDMGVLGNTSNGLSADELLDMIKIAGANQNVSEMKFNHCYCVEAQQC